MPYGFRGTPRTWLTLHPGATGDNAPMNPHHRRNGSALAHDNAGSPGPGNPRRSVGRSSQTPRDGRYGDRAGRPGTLPPVPGRPTSFRLLPAARLARPRALLAALFALGVTAFCLLTWQVSAHGRLVGPDGRLLRAFLRTAAAHPGYGATAHRLCDLGDIPVAVPVLLLALVAAARLGRRAALPRWWLPPAAAALAMAVLPVVVTAVKSAVDRPAPGRVHPDPAYGYFPSGHTATSAVGFGLAALLLMPYLRRTAARGAAGRGHGGAAARGGRRAGVVRLPLAAGRPGQLVPGGGAAVGGGGRADAAGHRPARALAPDADPSGTAAASEAPPRTVSGGAGQEFVGNPRLMPPWEGSGQRWVTALPRVKNRTPSSP